MSTTGLHRPRSRPHAALALWLVALAFLLRAFVPVGYMPDAHASREGRVAITFCTAAGGQAVIDVLLGPQRSGTHYKDDASGLADCSFAVLAHLAQDLPATLAPVLHWMVAPLVLPAYTPPALIANPATGPPLGSRAPPARSVPA